MKIWIGNYSTVRRLLERFLSEQGITRIEILNQTFDPQWHKVADIVADSTKPDGTITEEVKKGYVWQNQVLRKAEVVVVRNAEGGAEEPAG
jgi:molecular chaperone GrpE